MLLNLTFTLLSNNTDEVALLAETVRLCDMIEKGFKDKGLLVFKLVAGVHKNAARLHTHTGIQIQYNEKDEVKFWNKKVIAIVGYKSQDFDLKISVWRETDAGFDLQPLLGYPLKEYESLENYPFYEIAKGVGKAEIEEMREWAHDKYLTAKKEQERNEERKKVEDNEGEQIAQYLRENMSQRKLGCQITGMSFTQKMLKTKELIFMFYKKRYEEMGRRNFKVLSVRDRAAQFLLFEGHVTAWELADAF